MYEFCRSILKRLVRCREEESDRNSSASIKGHLDYPENGQVIDSVIEIAGWVLGASSDSISIHVSIDGLLRTEPIQRIKRDDVHQAFPGFITFNPEPGFTMNVDISRLSSGSHNLRVVADTNNRSNLIGQKRFILRRQEIGRERKHGILDEYITIMPDSQNALDIFKGEWSSRLPSPYNLLSAGKVPLFEDSRIDWLSENIEGFTGRTVLELGPLEGGHTYMIENKGARSILSIESNTRAYLKCLIVKEILELHRSHYLLGDFNQYLLQNDNQFDVVIASGVLYHMINPVALIELLSKKTSRLFIWSHYYDKDIMHQSYTVSRKFHSATSASQGGFSHTLYRQEYQSALGWMGFCGGPNSYSNWMTRSDILDSLRYFGFDEIRIGFDEPSHPNGPAFALVALRHDHSA